MFCMWPGDAVFLWFLFAVGLAEHRFGLLLFGLDVRLWCWLLWCGFEVGCFNSVVMIDSFVG